MGDLLYLGDVLQYEGQTLEYNETPTPPDPYAPWGGFANWQRLRLLEYV